MGFNIIKNDLPELGFIFTPEQWDLIFGFLRDSESITFYHIDNIYEYIGTDQERYEQIKRLYQTIWTSKTNYKKFGYFTGLFVAKKGDVITIKPCFVNPDNNEEVSIGTAETPHFLTDKDRRFPREG